MSKIKSRKYPSAPPSRATDRVPGLVLASLPTFILVAQSATAAEERVLEGVQVQETVEDSYKAEAASSPKWTSALLDTPQTVTVIRKELLADQGAGSLGEALRNTPGVTFTLGENGNTTAGDSITMRGFDTSGSIYLDGIRDLGAVSRDTFNTEQVEIVKGPSGADNGRGAPTGYINLSSKQPTLEAASSATLSGGTDSRIRAATDFNQPLGAIDGSAVRLNLVYDKGDKLGRDVAENERWGIAPAFALGLGGNTRAYVNYLYVKQNNVPDGGIPSVGIVGYRGGFASPNPPTAQNPAIPQSILDTVNAALSAAPRVDLENFYGSPDDYEHVQANMFTVKLEHDFSESTTLRNTSRYGRTRLQRVITGINALTVVSGVGASTVLRNPSAWTITRSRQGRDETNEILTNQTNLTTSFATGSIGHSFSSGFEFIYEKLATRGMAAVGTTSAANLYDPSTADTFAPVRFNGAATDGNTVTAAAYAFDTLKFTDQWSLNLGVRFEHYQTESSGVAAPVAPATTGVGTFVNGQGNLLTGKAGVVFKPVESGSVYAAVATSQQPPGGANFTLSTATTGSNVNNPNLEPQKATNLEVGTKWELFDNLLVLSLAAYDTRNKNDLSTPADPVTGIVEQYGERRVRGVELGASGMITPNWQVSGGIASMDTEVKEGTGAAGTTGAQLQYSPKLTFTSWTTYKLPFGLTIGGGARFTDSQFRNGNATQANVTALAQNPSSWVIDLMAGYTLNERVSFQLNAWNVGDEFYLQSLNNGGSRFSLGAPRSFLGSVTVTF